jgi:putative flippase GtrA
MKKTVLKFGLYGFCTAAVLFFLALVLGSELSYKAQEIIGYSSIVISLLFVFFGIKNYRDKENNGYISFGRALGVGMLITLFAALGFAIIDFVYTSYINPEFVESYMNHSIEKLQLEYSGEELANKTKEVKESFEGMTSFGLALFMFSTVILIGFIISLISSLVLNKK